MSVNESDKFEDSASKYSEDDVTIDEAEARHESILITTDSFEEFSHEMSTSLKDDVILQNNTVSNISEIQQETFGESSQTSSNCDNNEMKKSESFNSNDTNKELNVYTNDNREYEYDYFQDPEWYNKNHVFILSISGKPIYSLHGNEDKLAPLFGVMQVLVSVVQSSQDTIKSIQTAEAKFVFLVRSPLILVAVNRSKKSVQQIQMHLTDVYNQILSTLTLSTLTKTYEKRNNFDFRRLLAGSERFIDHLLRDETTNNAFMFLTHTARILPMNQNVRDNITSAIQNNCSKIKNLVFAILIAKNKLIALVRMKKYCIHPADLRIIFNLVECSESFKTGESWIPICLPKFDSNGFLHTHCSYLSEDCQACLLLMSVEKDAFFTLSNAKKGITEKLRRSNCLEAINEALNNKGVNLKTIGIPEIRHFLYNYKSMAQLLCSEVVVPYNTPEQFSRLKSIYYDVHHRLHNTSRPLKLIYEMKEKDIILAWVTREYELFVTFEPTIDKNDVTTSVNKLLNWIKKEENVLFILKAPNF